MIKEVSRNVFCRVLIFLLSLLPYLVCGQVDAGMNIDSSGSSVSDSLIQMREYAFSSLPMSEYSTIDKLSNDTLSQKTKKFLKDKESLYEGVKDQSLTKEQIQNKFDELIGTHESVIEELTSNIDKKDVNYGKLRDSIEHKYKLPFSMQDLKMLNQSLDLENVSNKGIKGYSKDNKTLDQISDSLSRLDFIKKVESFKQDKEWLYESLRNQGRSQDDLKNTVETLLGKHEPLINELSTDNEELDTYSAFKDSINHKYKISTSIQQMEMLHSNGNLEKVNKEDLNKLASGKTKARLERDSEDKLKKELPTDFDQLGFAPNHSFTSIDNYGNWPLDTPLESSKLMSYYDYYSDTLMHKVDSIQSVAYVPSTKFDHVEGLEDAAMDSIKNIVNDKEWLKVGKTKVDEGLAKVDIKTNNLLALKPDYTELIIGFDKDNPNKLSLTPNIAYELFQGFNAGVGLELNFDLKNTDNFLLGYKGFARYKPEKSIFYCQLESVLYYSELPTPDNGQSNRSFDNSIDAGVGILYKVGRHISLNGIILYNVKKSGFPLDDSPLSMRLGISLN